MFFEPPMHFYSLHSFFNGSSQSGEYSLKRSLMTAAGIAAVVIGLLGIYLPGVPTTGPLLLASFLFAKSNPRLLAWLRQNALLGKYCGYIDGTQRMTAQTRAWAITCMWTSIAVSSLLLAQTELGRTVIVPLCLLSGVVGTIVILRFQSNPSSGFSTLAK